jgi:hypothetical protein
MSNQNQDVVTIQTLRRDSGVCLNLLDKIVKSRNDTASVARYGKTFFTEVQKWMRGVADKEYRDRFEQDLIMLLSTTQQLILVADQVNQNSDIFKQEFKAALKNMSRESEKSMNKFYRLHAQKGTKYENPKTIETSEGVLEVPDVDMSSQYINEQVDGTIRIYEQSVKISFLLNEMEEERQEGYFKELDILNAKYFKNEITGTY